MKERADIKKTKLETHYNRPTCKLIFCSSIGKFLYYSRKFLGCTLERFSSIKEVEVSIALRSCYRCNERRDL